MNTIGNGHCTPTISPSKKTCTSRKGLIPGIAPTVGTKERAFVCGTPYHQNSSACCPFAEREITARRALRGKLVRVMALSSGTCHALALFSALLRAERGMMTSAGPSPFLSPFISDPAEVKNVAVSVALNAAVYVSSTRFPKSKITLCGRFQRERNGVASLRCVQDIPRRVGSAVEVRQSSVSPK